MQSFHKKIYLSSPTMHGEEQAYVQEAFDTNWVAPLGKNVDMFEQSVADYVGMRSAAALISGTAGLHLAVKLAEVQKDDIVFCSDLTFVATVNPVSYEGGRPVFIDSEKETWNMDPQALEAAFDKYNGINLPKPKAVIIANLYGTPAKLAEIKELCDMNETVLIEDAAESLGATYHGQQTGSFGRWNVISFNGNKIITTSGGGMLLSNDESAVKKVRFWATQARENSPYYQHKEIGYNYRMSNIVAGIGCGQMQHLNEHVARKKAIYMRYKEKFKELPVSMNPYLVNTEPNFWLSCLLIDARKTMVKPEDIRQELAKYNVEARPIWKPMHMQPVYKKHDYVFNRSCVSEEIFDQGICLPSDIKMTIDEQNDVIDIIKGLF